VSRDVGCLGLDAVLSYDGWEGREFRQGSRGKSVRVSVGGEDGMEMGRGNGEEKEV
jgi:hypothetical protein